MEQLQTGLLYRGDYKSVLFLWRQIHTLPASLRQCEEIRGVCRHALHAFMQCVVRAEGCVVDEDLLTWLNEYLLRSASEAEKESFFTWLVDYSTQRLSTASSLLSRRNLLIILLRNLLALTATFFSFPLAFDANPSLTERVLRLHSYLQNLLEVAQTAQLPIAPSASLQLQSSEELVVALLDDLQNEELLSEELKLRVAPFCVERNMSLDEVLSYFIQRELEKVGELNERRLRFLWDAIESHNLRIEALKGVESRLPPYSEVVLGMIEEGVGYVCVVERDDT